MGSDRNDSSTEDSGDDNGDESIDDDNNDSDIEHTRGGHMSVSSSPHVPQCSFLMHAPST